MKQKAFLYPFLAFAGVLAAFYIFNHREMETEESFDYSPSEWFFTQRAYPFEDIPLEKYFRAIEYKTAMLEKSSEYTDRQWQPSGPYNIGGRITALDVDPDNPDVIYAGAAAGGIFKSTDGGQSWQPKTDNFPSLSVGALKIDPSNSSIIYCGTGEANSSADSYPGFGMLKSTDKGESWFVCGLENSMHIAEIEIHPKEHNTIYTAVTGGLRTKGNNRGIYKSNNAGKSWKRVLFVSDSTSAVDVAVDPSDTNIVYAAMWERLRGPSFRKSSGLSSAIYRSTDAGTTWQILSGGLPAASKRNGRISIAVAKSNPNYVYALYKVSSDASYSDNVFGSFYRSTNKGVSWTKMNDGILPSEFSNFGWYFGLMEVDPLNHEKLYLGEVDLLRSTDGGNSWTNITYSYSGSFDQQHPDQHALWINPKNTSHMILGNDGGIFKTTSGASPWTKLYDLPVTQFYASTIDFLKPQRIYGGTQDNGTMGTKTGGLADWEEIFGGDGFHTQVDYTNSDIIYAESQWGNLGKSSDGGLTFNYAMNGIENDRTNWSTPYIIDPVDHNTLYFGTYRLYRTTDGAENWISISPDLTRGQNGRLGTLTSVSCASLSGGQRVIYTGADDGKVSVTTNSGGVWKDISTGLPVRYVTDILADKRNGATAYVTLSGFHLDQSNSHIFRTTDFGNKWTDISGNLPDVPLNAVIIDWDSDSLLYVGGDAGVYYTTNLGRSWNLLGTGLPNAPVADLNYHQPSGKLVAATHGRSIYTIDIKGIASGIGAAGSSNPLNFSLKQNYPNPFNPSTKITYTLSEASHVRLTIYDAKGEMVSVAVDKTESSGEHSVTFNAGRLSSGIYFYRLEVMGKENRKTSEAKKMVLVR